MTTLTHALNTLSNLCESLIVVHPPEPPYVYAVERCFDCDETLNHLALNGVCAHCHEQRTMRDYDEMRKDYSDDAA